MKFAIKKDSGYTLPSLFTRPIATLKSEGYDKNFYSAEVEKAIKQVNECLADIKRLLEDALSYEEKYKLITKYFDPVEGETDDDGVFLGCSRPQTSIQSGMIEHVVESFSNLDAVSFFIKAHSDISSFFERTDDEEIKKFRNFASKNAKKTKSYERFLKWCEFFVNEYWEEIKVIMKVKE